MTNPLQQLLALTQGGQPMSPGMAATGPSDMASETPDIMAQLQALMGGGGGQAPIAPAPGGAAPPAMSQAISSMLPPGGSGGPDPRAMSLGVSGRTGPATDSDYYDMHEANQGVRGDLPPKPQRDYSGYGEEMEPMDDPRQTPSPSEGPGNPKYDQTKSELDDVSKRMGGNPEEDGNFPSQAEIDALNSGKIDPVDFDKKWGKGAAAEMQDVGKGDDGDTDDEGDHEYR